jgi:hypothetical protein
MQNAKGRMQNAECRMQNAKGRMRNAECRMQNAKGTIETDLNQILSLSVMANVRM